MVNRFLLHSYTSHFLLVVGWSTFSILLIPAWLPRCLSPFVCGVTPSATVLCLLSHCNKSLYGQALSFLLLWLLVPQLGQHTPGDEVVARWVYSVLCAPESAGITCRDCPCLFGQLVTVLHCPETLE